MRRIAVCATAFLVSTGTVLVLPVYAAPTPEPVPVAPDTQDVEMGSVAAPAEDADVQDGPTDPVRGVKESTPVLTVRETDPEPFSLVGVSWAYDPAVTDTLVKIRVRDEDGEWGDWTEVEKEAAFQDPSATSGAVVRDGASPLWTGPSTGVEAELVTRSGAQPTDVTLNLIDPGESEADDSLGAADITDKAEAELVMPAVFSRAQWGADDSIRTWAPQYAPTLKAATVHHTADSNDYTADQVPAILRSIYAYHTVNLKWGDIGYNVIVDKFGRLFEGRYGGLASTVIGAHAAGFNTGTFGVSMLGNYEVAATPQPMIDAVASIIGWKFSLYGIDPKGSTVLTSAGLGGTSRYAAGVQVTVPTVFGHRDVGRTVCPGQYGYARMPEIRAKAAGMSGNEPFVRSLYQDMMGRAADQGGLDGWVRWMYAGANQRLVSRGFANSTEYRMLRIQQAYQQVFGRDVDPAGRVTWMQALANGSATLNSLRPALMASQEFYLRGGSSDAGFVDNIYRAALDRGAAPSEVAYWAAFRRANGSLAVITAVWGSPEAAMRRVVQNYQYYLGRPAGVSEQHYWLPVVMGAGDEQLREEMVSSYEYLLRSLARFPA